MLRAKKIMASSQEKGSEDIYNPHGNKSAMWKYFEFLEKKKKRGQQTKHMLYTNDAVSD